MPAHVVPQGSVFGPFKKRKEKHELHSLQPGRTLLFPPFRPQEKQNSTNFFSFLWNSSYFFPLSFPRLNGKLSKHGEKKDTACLLSPTDADDAVGDAF